MFSADKEALNIKHESLFIYLNSFGFSSEQAHKLLACVQ